MQFTQDQTTGQIVSSYEPGKLIVSGTPYSSSVIIEPTCTSAWGVNDAAQVNFETLSELFAKKPDVIIVGTGRNQYFPPAEVYLPMMQTGIGVEIMDSAAAARTYNVLLSEGRNVIAAIIV